MSAVPDIPAADHVQAAYDTLLAGYRAEPYPSWRTRRKRLMDLLDAVVARREDVARAISADFGHRSWHETMVADVWMVADDIRKLVKNVRRWMRPSPRGVPYYFRPATARVQPVPKGVVGVIAPWNYPFQLSISPAAGALAAGNRVLIKPSELAPRTSALVAEMIADLFPPDVCQVVQGGVEVSQAVADLPLDHLFFTGSPRVGRMVMEAAARTLTPVTLELGGKCPLIVTPGFDVERAARAAVLGKLFNAGQTCLAVDTVLVDQRDAAALVERLQSKMAEMYPAPLHNPDYTAIVNDKHRARLRALLDDAARRGATVIEVNPAGEDFSDSPKLAPRIVLDCPPDADLMQEEIFGPILPVVTYERFDEVRQWLIDHPDPLALYLMDDDPDRAHRVVTEARCGGMVVNDVLLHFACHDLPFGGIRTSGIGAYHGRDSFDTFSHHKAVVYQARVNGVPLFHPPYGNFVNAALKFFIGTE